MRATKSQDTPTIADLIETACARIAPAWPLDRTIAVNPYWGWIDRPISSAAAQLGALQGSTLTMPRAWYRQQRDAGLLTDAAIERAIAEQTELWTTEAVVAALHEEAVTPTRFPLLTDVHDVARAGTRAATCHEVMLAQIGRTAEVFFDTGEATWLPDRHAGLYALWRTMARADLVPRLELGVTTLGKRIDALPDTALGLIDRALDALPVPTVLRESYITALLHSVGGWAAAAAFRRWEARQQQRDDASIVDLLAIRLAWEHALFTTTGGTDLALRWTRAWRQWQDEAERLEAAQRVDWILQRALELRYHEQLARALGAQPSPRAWDVGPASLPTLRAQVVCCIDVRSERLRRALEAVDHEVSTLGFAGFFGLPAQYTTLTGHTRQHLPGLLTPSLAVEDQRTPSAKARATDTLHAATQWDRTRRGAASTFAAVEATGIASLFSLVQDAFGPFAFPAITPTTERAPLTLTRVADGATLSTDERAALAAAVLRAMSLTSGFARLVAFVGHGATVTNNPQAAGLACGACGGESGEVSARLLAALLNDAAVRDALPAHGITIPASTWFVAGLHDTVTDDLTYFDAALVPDTHREDLGSLITTSALASAQVRQERAPSLGLSTKTGHELHEALQYKASNWAEPRPEWALARNAVFIAAPRERTAAFDLKGRAFLHEYVWQRDTGYQTLTSILTAPVVVAHWINLQYYASVVDPERYGSGDKALHNIAGGNVGVYEGAGGDLRIGLARQSVHDGAAWRHDPLRLAVYVEAPAVAIDQIINTTPVVRDLVANQWIHLYRIASDESGVWIRRTDRWEKV